MAVESFPVDAGHVLMWPGDDLTAPATGDAGDDRDGRPVVELAISTTVVELAVSTTDQDGVEVFSGRATAWIGA